MAYIERYAHGRALLLLLPASVEDYVPAYNPVRVIDAFIDDHIWARQVSCSYGSRRRGDLLYIVIGIPGMIRAVSAPDPRCQLRRRSDRDAFIGHSSAGTASNPDFSALRSASTKQNVRATCAAGILPV